MIPLLLTGLFGCNEHESGNDNGSGETLYIVTTTGMIADAISNIAREKAVVKAIMGPGVDPHLYKAVSGDLQLLRKADMVFYNGLHLEGKMGEVLEKMERDKPVIAISAGLTSDEHFMAPGQENTPDPHIWFDVSLWAQAVEYAGNMLQEYDTANAAFYKKNMEAYLKELRDLHEWTGEQIASIPEGQRVLITAHDAFEYFGRAYNIEVKGLQGISTVAELGLQDRTHMVDFIYENDIKAIFVESSVPRQAIEAVQEGVEARGKEVKIGGTLYSDAMGRAGTSEGTYIGMVQANVNTIVSALK